MTQSVNPLLHSDFWQHGAFIRLSADAVWVAQGPWQKVSEDFADVGSQSFFASFPEWQKATSSQIFSLPEFVGALKTWIEKNKSETESSFSARDFVSESETLFSDDFRQIQGRIHRGEVEKALPITRRKILRAPSAFEKAKTLLSVLTSSSDFYAFGLWSETEGVIGASPEILFSQNGKNLISMALAGTSPNPTPADRIPLDKDPKELKEHALVVIDLAARLTSLGSVRQMPTEILELPRMKHLKTSFQVSGCHKSASEIMRWLHPTPAMAVAPRLYGHRWLQELSLQKERDLFGAPLCFRISAQENICVVAIRSLFWTQSLTQVWAGCGVVKASRLEQEWQLGIC
jgi:isochorismate synthase EntC